MDPLGKLGNAMGLSETQLESASLYQAMSGLYGNKPPQTLLDTLHGPELRRAAYRAALHQGYPNYQGMIGGPAKSAAVVRMRTGADHIPFRVNPASDRWFVPGDRSYVQVANNPPGFLDSWIPMAHEAAHYRQPVEIINSMPNSRALKEIGPSLADLPTIAQSHLMATGKPLRHTVPLAGGQDIEWMRRQAEKHGLFSGKHIDALLADQIGRQYLEMLLNQK